MSEYHKPVMLEECLDGMNIQPGGTYVDVTFGGGGHSKGIMGRLESGGRLFAFDQDQDALNNELTEDGFQLIHQNFRHLKNYLRVFGVRQVDAVLADLGVSSYQFDKADRGFSIRFEALLDMRMDQESDLTAVRILNEYEENHLAEVFKTYGELRGSYRMAKAIVAARAESSVETMEQLKKIVKPYMPPRKENQFMAQLFQALRIEVNDELNALKEMLEQAAEVLRPGGRLVVMSYHSLEDRLVKNFINNGKFEGEAEKDFYGNKLVPLKKVSRKPITANEEELKVNTRSRSAKLRIAEKLDTKI